ncbi:hypothetical protein H2201_008728 [Coniosporium apollinis]|uniref:J domain-containing protein n=1 Tax=Coniosporium apollinis TaxID=61459 RepID=A0ABQ9NHX5_9PEZI|nr:hypothetical protein H2201_008728 [Coniosporium apollinis]
MVGVSFRHLEEVDIFNLLGLDLYELQDWILEKKLKKLRIAYLRGMRVAHPDKTQTKEHFKAQQLNTLKEYLYGFDQQEPEIVPRIKELFCKGKEG